MDKDSKTPITVWNEKNTITMHNKETNISVDLYFIIIIMLYFANRVANLPRQPVKKNDDVLLFTVSFYYMFCIHFGFL